MPSAWCILTVVAFTARGEQEAEAAYCCPLGPGVLGVAGLWPAVRIVCPVLHSDQRACQVPTGGAPCRFVGRHQHAAAMQWCLCSFLHGSVVV